MLNSSMEPAHDMSGNGDEELEQFLSVWNLGLPEGWEFDELNSPPELTPELLSRLRAYARATMFDTPCDDLEVMKLVHQFRGIYEEYGRLCLSEYRENT